ncbi:MAG: multicopper oxidase domain-containing protein [Cyanobacteria bacterium J06635_10]
MGCSFRFLRRLLIVGLVGVFVSVNTFIGEAVADGTAFQKTCTLTPTTDLPTFKNPPFAYADNGQITLDATSDTFTLDGDTSGATYNGYLYGGTYYDVNTNQQSLKPTYTPPTIVVSAGNSIDLDLTNDLPINVELDGSLPQTEQNLESVSQDTNLHYHGFNVSPLLGSDDVVMHVHSNVTPKSLTVPPSPQTLTSTPPAKDQLTITYSGNDKDSYNLIPDSAFGTTPDSNSGSSDNLPGGIYPGDNPPPNNTYQATTEYDMEVNLPTGHQSGLFWYHPHVHTVSDNQVRAGMSGGIIVKGFEDSYTFLDPKIGIKANSTPLSKQNQPTPLAITQQVMMFKDFNDVLGDEQTPPDCFTLNGQLNPEITIQPGEIQFWRIANIGADEYLNLALETTDQSPPAFAEPNNPTPSTPTCETSKTNCNFYILARDSNVVEQPVATDSVLLPPASRVELLVVGGKSGDIYNLVSDFKTPLTSEQQKWVKNSNSYQLATVNVTGDELCYTSPDGSSCNGGTTLDSYITSVTPSVIDDILPDPTTLAGYQTCSTSDRNNCITPSNAYPEPITQTRNFKFSGAQLGSNQLFAINDEFYNENRIDKISHLGDIEEWLVQNPTGAPHAFHMHQLDFLVTEVDFQQAHDPKLTTTYDNYTISGTTCNPNGDVTKYSSCYDLEPQGYRDMINLPPHSQTTIRIPFLNPFITGVFVYHCHILAHEDRGMMQNLKVIDPKSYQPTSGLASKS